MNTPFTPESPIAGNHQRPPLTPRQSRFRRFRFWFTVIVLIILAIAIWHHFKSASKNPASNGKGVPVVVTSARITDVPVFVPALGAVTPTYTITVKTQINGQMLQVYFQEGQMVKAGDLLAEIDPRPYEAQLVQFEGDLKRDQAQLANAVIDLTRYQQLYPKGAVSQQTYATQAALVQQLEGTVQVDKGQIQATQLNLIYCHITSPVNGRIGLRLVDPGNFVQTTDTNGLFVIASMHPITVVFPIPEDNLPQVMQQMRTNKMLVVEAYDRTQNKLLATGGLMAVDSQIDPTTGTVKLKALFPNEENTLFPQQFVNIQLLVDTLRNVIVVPTAAVQFGPKGPFVFVVKDNHTVKMQFVTTGETYGMDTVIKTGIAPDQVVVVQGADKLSDGVTVSVTTTPSSPVNPVPGESNTNTITPPQLPMPQLQSQLPTPAKTNGRQLGMKS